MCEFYNALNLDAIISTDIQFHKILLGVAVCYCHTAVRPISRADSRGFSSIAYMRHEEKTLKWCRLAKENIYTTLILHKRNIPLKHPGTTYVYHLL
jgi:hypothetical protein